MITLTLTAEQTEILGYALTSALRREDHAINHAKRGSAARAGANERFQRIEELRRILDTQPETQAGEG